MSLGLGRIFFEDLEVLLREYAANLREHVPDAEGLIDLGEFGNMVRVLFKEKGKAVQTGLEEDQLTVTALRECMQGVHTGGMLLGNGAPVASVVETASPLSLPQTARARARVSERASE
jgi:hypothetical protein